jgi:hypothetical protein
MKRHTAGAVCSRRERFQRYLYPFNFFAEQTQIDETPANHIEYVSINPGDVCRCGPQHLEPERRNANQAVVGGKRD